MPSSTGRGLGPGSDTSARPAPASFNQVRFWTLEQLASPVNAWRFWKIDGPLDVSALEAACRSLVQRHELLRTRFFLDGDQLMQAASGSAAGFHFELHDLGDTPNAQEQVQAEAELAVARPFDLGQPFPVRFHAWQTGSQRCFLLILVHHIVCDGWSWGVLHRDFSALYARESGAASPPLAAVPSFTDFTARESLFLASPQARALLAETLEQLRDVPALELPRDRTGGETSRRAGRYNFSIPAPTSERFKALARNRGATGFAAWLAVFALCLARQSGQYDFALGIAAANRADTTLEPLVGPVATLVPVRVRMAPAQTFDALLQQASDMRLQVLARQGLPFDWLTRNLGLRPHHGTAPPVQAVLSYRNMPDDGLAMQGLDAQPMRLPSDTDTTDFDLALEIAPRGQATEACLVYRAGAFDAASIALVAQRLQRLVSEVCDDPGRPLDAYPALGEAEEQLILHDWAGQAGGKPSELTIHEAFERQARLRPDAVALVTAQGSLTYGELDALSTRACANLRTCGAGKGVVVAVLFPPGLHFIVAILGILKSGAVYLPVDRDDPAHRVATMLSLAGCSLATGPADFRARVSREVRYVEDEGLLREPAPAASGPVDRAASGSVAYVMFTSGSTGEPKGVVTPHRGIVRLVVEAAWAGLRADDVFLLQSAPSFDGATFEIWGALLNGGCLVIPGTRLLSCHEMRDVLRTHRVTVLFLTTSVYNMFAAEDVLCLQGLRMLVVGGEALNSFHIRTGLEQLKDCRIVNGYGPTENTTFTCTYEVAAVEPGRPIPIGKPIDRTTVYILDASHAIVPAGVRGELYTGGDGLALGYLGPRALTDERFIEVPAARLGRPDGKAVRLYRTGDLARWRADGQVEYMGRADRQVKLRGFRIEMGELEAVILRCPGVRQVVACLKEGNAGPMLVAYVVGSTDAAALRAWAKSRIPAWMVPDQVIVMDGIPLRSTGKVDFDALPDLQPVGAATDSPEMTPLEQQVAVTMAAVLNCAHVGPRDDFYSLGGNSLRALQFLGRLENDFGRRIAAADFLQQPTVEHAAHLLSSSAADEFPEEIELLRRGESGTPVFFAHSIAGSGLYARVYLPYLPAASPVYGLRMLMARGPAPASLAALAEKHVRAIRAVQPSGPYHLAGYSFGAHLAFEMAHQLAKQGERIDTLAIIDSTPRFEQEELHLGADLPASPEATSKKLLVGYRHPVVDARLLLFRSELRLDEPLLQPDGGWEVLVRRGVETLRFAGDHTAAVREPAARLIGERIALSMSGGQEPASGRLARKRDPSQVLAFAAGLAHRQQGRLREAMQLLEQAAVGGELAMGPLLRLVEVAAELGELEAAIGYARRAVECNPASTLARHTLAARLEDAGRAVEALAELDAAVATDGEDAEVRFLRSRLLVQLARLQLAREDARAAVLLRPGESRYREQLHAITSRVAQIAHGEAVLKGPLPRMHAGKSVQLLLELHNRSAQVWDASGPDAVLLSYHWKVPGGTSHTHDGVRSPMPRALAPGEKVACAVAVLCPAEPGPYWLELTAVQENVAWFETSNMFRTHQLEVVLVK
ncbi:MAG TPA: amino acid adenylation domain-containing protein [Ramlibacter sp.]|nr:amino acid adenylation domain-containing protein [Ramlibacter sp.]